MAGGGVGGWRWVGVWGGAEKLRLKLTSAKVEVEVEAELGKMVQNVVEKNNHPDSW